jgi:hypothetical protein
MRICQCKFYICSKGFLYADDVLAMSFMEENRNDHVRGKLLNTDLVFHLRPHTNDKFVSVRRYADVS